MCSDHLQGRGRGARVANLAKAVLAVAEVIRAQQWLQRSAYTTGGAEDRMRFYQRESRDAHAGLWRLDAFLCVIQHFRLQARVVDYLWGQWRGMDSATQMIVLYRVLRTG